MGLYFKIGWISLIGINNIFIAAIMTANLINFKNHYTVPILVTILILSNLSAIGNALKELRNDKRIGKGFWTYLYDVAVGGFFGSIVLLIPFIFYNSSSTAAINSSFFLTLDTSVLIVATFLLLGTSIINQELRKIQSDRLRYEIHSILPYIKTTIIVILLTFSSMIGIVIMDYAIFYILTIYLAIYFLVSNFIILYINTKDILTNKTDSVKMEN
jgi:hypothetical protein